MHADWRVLQQTRQWCHARIDVNDPARCLRSEELRPPDYPAAWGYGQFHPAWIDRVIARRAEQLPLLLQDSVPCGRILAVLQDADTYMGEGEPESQGVVDEVYLPPWDTWFAFRPLGGRGMLLAWIPREFELLVEAAREVAATEPLAWLDDLLTQPPASFGGWWDESLAQLQREAPFLKALLAE